MTTLDFDKLNREIDAIYDECVEAQFGLWITGLFYWVPHLSFAEQKEAFFLLLERLLREGKVKFVKPDADVYSRYDSETKQHYRASNTVNDPETHWDVPVEDILAYLREHWPESATHKNDIELTAYFYEIPTIIWRGDDGKWYSS